jgi:heme-degrading monooxygenase HmoA
MRRRVVNGKLVVVHDNMALRGNERARFLPIRHHEWTECDRSTQLAITRDGGAIDAAVFLFFDLTGRTIACRGTRLMFAVLFELHPKPDQWDTYLRYAAMLRPELERIDGFVDNVRYRSLTREGWLLSLSGWRDEKSLVRWRTHASHHGIQQRARADVFADYHLRVGQMTRDTRLPAGQSLDDQRLDETQTSAGTAVVLIDARRPEALMPDAAPDAIAARLGLVPDASALVAWDVFDAVLTPGDMILATTWCDCHPATAFAGSADIPAGGRVRCVRIIRDYGMFDRREAPQYHPDVERE